MAVLLLILKIIGIILLILLGLSHRVWKNNRFAYPLTVAGTACVSVGHALQTAGVPLGIVGRTFEKLPLYTDGFGWVWAAAGMLLVSIPVSAVKKRS